jgi:hypothetical protein
VSAFRKFLLRRLKAWTIILVSLFIFGVDYLPQSVEVRAIASVAPPGATTVRKSSLKPISGGFFCRKIGTTWIPGSLYYGKYFLSHSQQIVNISRRSQEYSGSKRTIALSQISIWKKRNTVGLSRCARYHSMPSSLSSTTTTSLSSSPSLRVSEHVVEFDLNDAVGVVLNSDSVTASSVRKANEDTGLLKLLSNGQLKSAVSGTTAKVRDIYVASDNLLYVSFEPAINLVSGPCVLVSVNPQSSKAECVDRELTSIVWFDPAFKRPISNPPIQIGADGVIVYQGVIGERQVLRRKSGAKATDLLSATQRGEHIGDFLLLSDGSVIVSGSNYSTGCSSLGVTQITRIGEVVTLTTCDTARFVKQMPDGTVWLALQSDRNTPLGVRRLDPKTGSWISETSNPWDRGQYVLSSNVLKNRFPEICSFESPQPWTGQWSINSRLAPEQISPYWMNLAFCAQSGTMVMRFYDGDSGQVFGLAGSEPSSRLVQYFPNVVVATSDVRLVSHAVKIDKTFLLSGLNSQFQNVLSMYSTSTDSEVKIDELSVDYEVQQLGAATVGDVAFFQVKRISDGRLLSGSINIRTREVLFLAEQTKVWSTLQVLG